MKKFVFIPILILILTMTACSSTTNNGKSENAGQQQTEQPESTASAIPTPEPKKADFPTKPIDWIIPYAPGGANDVTARLLAPAAEKYLPNKQPINIVNKPGGGATIGITYINNAKPDGYTIGTVTAGGIAIEPHFGKVDYKDDSFQPIMKFYSAIHFMLVRSDSPWKTFDEWLDYAKQNPHQFKYGVVSIQGTDNLAMQGLSMEAGIEAVPGVYNGEADGVRAILGGNIQGVFLSSQTAAPHIEEGTLRPLVNITRTKPESMKDIPTLEDLGYEAYGDFFSGIVAPKGLAEDKLQILHEALLKALNEPDMGDKLAQMGVNVDYAGPEDFQKDISATYEFNGKVLKTSGLLGK